MSSLSRRRVLGLGLAAASGTVLGRGCATPDEGGGPPEPPGLEPIIELTSSPALYDDFEGNGNLQEFDGKNLAVTGALGPKIWGPSSGARVVESPTLGLESPMARHYLELSSAVSGYESAWLTNPMITTFAEFRSLSADVCLAADPATISPYAFLNFHTTIPEQPPGKSWFVNLGIIRDPAGRIFILGEYRNINLGIIASDDLGPAMLEEWHNLRLDVMIKRDDPSLSDPEIRLDYYVDGALKASRIPEDSAILIDPQRTGLGPHRSLIVTGQKGTGAIIGRFDNVRAVYSNRIS
jgi:hypothetical protein